MLINPINYVYLLIISRYHLKLVEEYVNIFLIMILIKNCSQSVNYKLSSVIGQQIKAIEECIVNVNRSGKTFTYL